MSVPLTRYIDPARSCRTCRFIELYTRYCSVKDQYVETPILTTCRRHERNKEIEKDDS